jgi:autotransporter-associated beta strand protein
MKTLGSRPGFGLCFALSLVSLLACDLAHAGSATWALNAGTSWGTSSNWLPNTVPDGPDDVATFDVSNSTAITVNDKEVNSIVFNPGASAYTISSFSIGSFSITGAGVINDSGTTQNLVATSPFALIGLDNGASAGTDVVFTAQGSSTTDNGTIVFHDVSNGGNATLIAGGGGDVTQEGEITFYDNSSAGNATVIADIALGTVGHGGLVSFVTSASADNATLIANSAGPGGGLFIFSQKSSGGTGRVILNGSGTGDASNGALLLKRDFGRRPFAIGSLEGEGILNVITPGGDEIDIGSNNLSTTFGGRITGGATITKVGTGTLILTNGASTYTLGTNVNQGALLVSNTTGLGAGGPIKVNAGTLGGSGTVAGPVTVGTGSGTGAFFAPAYRAGRQATFTIQNALTFNADSTYSCSLKAKGDRARNDQVVAGGVTIQSGATFSLRATIRGSLVSGTVFAAISNTSATPIGGTFNNLPDGGLITAGGTTFQADYEGGDGNDLTLIVVP